VKSIPTNAGISGAKAELVSKISALAHAAFVRFVETPLAILCGAFQKSLFDDALRLAAKRTSLVQTAKENRGEADPAACKVQHPLSGHSPTGLLP
jgi:hypothetical protein